MTNWMQEKKNEKKKMHERTLWAFTIFNSTLQIHNLYHVNYVLRVCVFFFSFFGFNVACDRIQLSVLFFLSHCCCSCNEIQNSFTFLRQKWESVRWMVRNWQANSITLKSSIRDYLQTNNMLLLFLFDFRSFFTIFYFLFSFFLFDRKPFLWQIYRMHHWTERIFLSA